MKKVMFYIIACTIITFMVGVLMGMVIERVKNLPSIERTSLETVRGQ